MSNTRKRSSQSKAAIEASLQIAQEYAQAYAQLVERDIQLNPLVSEQAVTDRELGELPTRTQVVRP